MTKEERLEKWFRNIPNAETIPVEKRLEICNKVAKKMAILFLVIIVVECIFLFLISEGAVFDYLADLLNQMLGERHTVNHFRGVAIGGALLCLPLFILPVLAVLNLRRKWVHLEVVKLMGTTSNNGTALDSHTREKDI